MNKCLQVREFDTITCNKLYDGKPGFGVLDEKVFKELTEFVREYTTVNDAPDILEFMRLGYKRTIGDIITIKNYVGIIQLNSGWQIEILPKIELGNSDEASTQTKKVFLNMLRSMKGFPGKDFSDASLKINYMNLYEIFINMYLQEVRLLVKHGLKSAYTTHEDNLHCFKGKLNINEQIKRNLSHQERFYMVYDEYDLNRAENKLIKSTLLKLQSISSSYENLKGIRQLLMSFEQVNPSSNIERDFQLVVKDRNTNDYEQLMIWSNVFLMDKSFSTFSGDTKARALLFPMEKVFEAYVAKSAKKVFIPAGWDVSVQDKGFYLFDEPGRKFSLRPDLVLRRDNRIVVMDTKWKVLVDDSRSNYGISQSDMYQMYAYGKKYVPSNSSEIWLLYPKTKSLDGYNGLSFKSNDDVNVKIYFIDLMNIESSIIYLLSLIESEASH